MTKNASACCLASRSGMHLPLNSRVERQSFIDVRADPWPIAAEQQEG